MILIKPMPTKLGEHYKVISSLGRGGFGQTYLAEDQQSTQHSPCVIKQLKPQVESPQVLQTARRLFAAEAEVLQRIGSHPQIPQLFDYFEENQEFYLVQEFIEGDDLSQVLAAGEPLSEAEGVALLQEVLRILEFVHQQNVIHRDVNPRNLIRRKQDKKLVLIDFGAVKQINTQLICPQEQASSLTIAIGTPGYTPGEQANGKPKLNSDIYAVGMLAIYALTRISPQQLPEDPQTGEVFWRHHAAVSSRFAQILDQMVRYDFRARYQTAAAVLSDLDKLHDTRLAATQLQAFTKFQSRKLGVGAKSWLILAPLAISGMSLGFPKLLPARQNQLRSLPASVNQPSPGTQQATATPVATASPVATPGQGNRSTPIPTAPNPASPKPASKPAPVKPASLGGSPPAQPAVTPVTRKPPVPTQAPPVKIRPQPRPAQQLQPVVNQPPVPRAISTQVSQPPVVKPVTKVMIRVNPQPPAAVINIPPPKQETPIFQAPQAKPKPPKAPNPAKGVGKGKGVGKSKGKGKQ